MDCGRVQKVRWSDVRQQMMAVNPEIASCVDAVDKRVLREDLFITQYGYGELMVDRGRFLTPCQDHSCSGCQTLSKRVSYSCIPFAILLERSVEVFLECGLTSDNYADRPPEDDFRLVPLRLLGQGEMFGVFELLDCILSSRSIRPPWSVSAGSRSVWIVAPMGDERMHNSIKRKTGVRWAERSSPHWQLVRALGGSNWHTKVLMFPDLILKAVAGSPALRRLLLEAGWKQSTNLRHIPYSDANLQTSFLRQYIKTPLGELYQYTTIRHILDIATGSVPAFQPAARAKIPGGPFLEVEAALHEMLRGIAKDYQPVVLQPGHLSEEGDVGYYSFRCPSVPGPKLPRVANYADIPGTIHEVLKSFRKDSDVPLDFGKTTFFARTGDYSVEDHSEYLPIDELFPPNAEKSRNHKEVYLNSPFFVAGARIVRSRVPSDRAFSKAAFA